MNVFAEAACLAAAKELCTKTTSVSKTQNLTHASYS